MSYPLIASERWYVLPSRLVLLTGCDVADKFKEGPVPPGRPPKHRANFALGTLNRVLCRRARAHARGRSAGNDQNTVHIEDAAVCFAPLCEAFDLSKGGCATGLELALSPVLVRHSAGLGDLEW